MLDVIAQERLLRSFQTAPALHVSGGLFGAEHGTRGHETTGEKKSQAMAQITGPNRGELTPRIELAYSSVEQDINEALTGNGIAAVGFCLGEVAFLNAAHVSARFMHKLNAAVSFHRILYWPSVHSQEESTPGIAFAAFHGDDDPMMSSENVASFIQEMRDRELDWQLTSFSGALLAFTQRDKQSEEGRALGPQYDRKAAEQSWSHMLPTLRRDTLKISV